MVLEERSPILSSRLPGSTPGVSAGTRNAEIPSAPSPGPVRSIVTTSCAVSPLVTHALVPFSTQASPSSVAVARSPAASEPLSASDSENAASTSPRAIGRSHRSFCASVPWARSIDTGSELCTDNEIEIEASAAAISSMIIR